MDADPGAKQPLLQSLQNNQPAHQSRNNAYGSQQPASDQYAATRVDTLASYGQLVTPHNLQDSSQASQPEIQPQRGLDANEAGPSSSSASFPHMPERRRQPNITISDPIKHSEKSLMPGVSGSYVTYAVTSRMTHPKYSARGASVRRRFRDFVVSQLLPYLHHFHQHCPGMMSQRPDVLTHNVLIDVITHLLELHSQLYGLCNLCLLRHQRSSLWQSSQFGFSSMLSPSDTWLLLTQALAVTCMMLVHMVVDYTCSSRYIIDAYRHGCCPCRL